MVDKQEKRIVWIDIARGLGIIFVVFAHINTGIVGKWLYSFHVPLFFVLSGYVYQIKEESFFSFLKRKIKTMVVPYFCLGSVMLAFQICRNAVEGRFSVHTSMVMCVELIIQVRFWTLWFLACLFLLNLLFYPIVRFLHERGMVFFTLASTVLGLLYAKLQFPFLPWNIDVCLVASFFFCAGILLKKHYDNIRLLLTKNKSIILFFIALLINISSFGLNLKLSGEPLEMNSSLYGIQPLTFLAATCGCLSVIIVSHWVHVSWIQYIGKNSLLYYAWHQQIFIPVSSAILLLWGISSASIIIDLIQTAIILLAISGLNQIIVKTKLKVILGR